MKVRLRNRVSCVIGGTATRGGRGQSKEHVANAHQQPARGVQPMRTGTRQGRRHKSMPEPRAKDAIRKTNGTNDDRNFTAVSVCLRAHLGFDQLPNTQRVGGRVRGRAGCSSLLRHRAYGACLRSADAARGIAGRVFIILIVFYGMSVAARRSTALLGDGRGKDAT